ncbi:MAG: biopolymer transporter ExbD [Myxococcota bacterium]
MAVQRRQADAEPLNLIPVMNLVTILIPFLLMAAEFVQLAVIDSTLPAIGPPQPADPNKEEEDPPLNLSVALTNEGVRILGTGVDAIIYPDGAPQVAEGELKPPDVPCKSGGTCTSVDDYDWPEVTAILAKIKDENPDEETMILVPDSKIQYEVLVSAMDAAREDKGNPGPDGSARLLFPAVVIAGGAM